MRVPTCQLQHGFGRRTPRLMAYPRSTRSSCRRTPRRSTPTTASRSSPPAPPTRWATSRCAASTSPGWSPRRSSTATRCSAPGPTARAPRRPAPPALTGQDPLLGQPHATRTDTARTSSTSPSRSKGFQDWGMLGYFAGGAVREARPVGHAATGTARPGRPQALRRGRGDLRRRRAVPHPRHHPRGPDRSRPRSAARPIAEPIVYGERERRAVYEALNAIGSTADVDFVLLGCPHASLDQIQAGRAAVEGASSKSGHRTVDDDAAGAARASPTATGTPRSSGAPAARCSPTPARRCPGRPGGHQGVRHRLGQAGALPARDPRHRGLVRHLEECVDAAVTGRGSGHAGMTLRQLHGRGIVAGRGRGRGAGVARDHLRLGRHRPGHGHDHRDAGTSCSACASPARSWSSPAPRAPPAGRASSRAPGCSAPRRSRWCSPR